MTTLRDFVAESNRIEGITEVRDGEVEAVERLLRESAVTMPRMLWLVERFQPDARIRDRAGLNVYVGGHYPPPGGPEIVTMLREILEDVNAARIDPHEAHRRYESLHPFTDGNGRSGRALWLWQMVEAHGLENALALPFLHRWYYQSLAAGRP